MPAPRVPVELREFPEPSLEPGSLLLRTVYAEVCGTDVHIWHGRLAAVPFAIIPVDVAIEDALAKLNQALADAEVMRLPKALVKPN